MYGSVEISRIMLSRKYQGRQGAKKGRRSDWRSGQVRVVRSEIRTIAKAYSRPAKAS